MGLQKMHFYVPLKGNAFWELTEGEILERQKRIANYFHVVLWVKIQQG